MIAWWMWALFVPIVLLLATCAVLILHEKDIYPLREVTKLIRRPWFEVVLILCLVGGMVQYGATKGTNGTDRAEQPMRYEPPSAQAGGGSALDGSADCQEVTNLCFTEIAPLSNSVRLSLAWPTNAIEHSPVAVLIRDSTNGVVALEVPEPRPDLSWAGYPLSASYDLTADSDGDGIPDYDEVLTYDTDPWLSDSDGDGIDDENEIREGTDPRNVNSHPQRFEISVTNTEFYASMTNYVFNGSVAEWESNLLFACSGYGFETNICTNALFCATTMGAFRDLNRNGVYDADADILLIRDVSGIAAVKTVRFVFGDVDGDNVSDVDERMDDSDPYDMKSYWFNVAAKITSVPSMDGRMMCMVKFGTNEIMSATSVTNGQYEARFINLVTVNDESVMVNFWFDANTNGIWDANESYEVVSIHQRGRETTYAGVMPTSGFDQDRNGLYDWWEIETGLAAVVDRHCDCDDNDHDGLINLHEYWAGTDPLTPDGSNTVLSVCARSIDDRIFDFDGTRPYDVYSNYVENAMQGLFRLNTNCWSYGIDITCASMWHCDLALDQDCHPTNTTVTAISPRHVIYANHFGYAMNTNLIYCFMGRMEL